MRRILACLPLLGLASLAQSPAPRPYFNLHQLAPGVFAAIDAPHSPAGSNAGFIIGSNGVAVVDTFENVDAAQALLAAIRAKTSLPIRFVINTHYHLDHVTGNQVFSAAGAAIIAQRNVHAWIHRDNFKFFGPHPTPAQRARVEAYRAPDLGYNGNVTIWLGTRVVDIRTLQGHTGGDSQVLVPDANVVFTGDLFWNHLLPNLVDATTPTLLASLAALEHWPPHPATAAYVPGHGELGTRADLTTFRQYLVTLRRDIAQAHARGARAPGLETAVLAELKPQYGAWADFAHFAPLNIQQTAAELAGHKLVPRPGAAHP
ncbi:MAG: MBL fold metallo-hydrolase [Terriglobales bacterium]